MQFEKAPIVSVLIPTKNRSSLVSRAIDSILTQSFEDFELIIMDVSDNDLTREVIDGYKDSRIVYRRISNEVSAAISVNSTLQKSRGKYLAFCDDDDEWSSREKLAKQVNLLDALGEDYGFVSCGWEIWNDRTNQHDSFDLPKAKGDVFSLMLIQNVVLGTPTLLIRKEAYFAVGGFEEEIRYSADYLLLTKLSKYYKFDYIAEIMVLGHQYHEFGSSQHLRKRTLNYSDKLAYFLFFLDYFKSDYEANPLAKRSIVERIITMAVKAIDFNSFIKYTGIYFTGSFSGSFIFKRAVLFLLNAVASTPQKLFSYIRNHKGNGSKDKL